MKSFKSWIWIFVHLRVLVCVKGFWVNEKFHTVDVWIFIHLKLRDSFCWPSVTEDLTTYVSSLSKLDSVALVALSRAKNI